jgi:hypothetical protein
MLMSTYSAVSLVGHHADSISCHNSKILFELIFIVSFKVLTVVLLGASGVLGGELYYCASSL